jgi:hypothetical protein
VFARKKRLLPTIVKVKSIEKEDGMAGNDASVGKKSKTAAAEVRDETEEPSLERKEKPAAAADDDEEEEEEEEEKDEGILAGLLGGYDSGNCDDEEEDKKISPALLGQQNQTLPSAEDLLS